MKSIIIIDDDAGIQEAISFVFDPTKYRVVVYTDGQAILNGTFEIPSLFIIDKQLPGVSGIDLCLHLKKNPPTKRTPVIIMSASLSVNTLAKQAGADAFLEKPYRVKQLRDIVDQFT